MKQLIFSFLLLYSVAGFSQEKSTYPNRETTDFLYLDVYDEYVMAIGSCDAIWSSKDGGQNWKVEYFGYLGFHDVQLLPDQPTRAVILIEGKLCLYDMDEGIVETYDEFGSNPQVKAIDRSGGKLFLYGVEGIYQSDLVEIEWQLLVDVDTDTHGALGLMDATDSYIYYSTFDGALFKYNLTGDMTSELTKFDARLEELSMGNDSHGVLSLNNGLYPFRTTDGWESHTVLETFSYGRNIRASGEQNIMLALGDNFEVSTNGGETVIKRSLSEFSSMGQITRGFYNDEDSSIYLFGSGACLAHSINNGEDWTYANPYDRSDITNLDINSSGVGYAGGNSNNLVRTENSGLNWTTYNVEDLMQVEIVGLAAMENEDLIIATVDEIIVIRDNKIINTESASPVLLFRDQNDAYLLCEVFKDGEYQLLRSGDDGFNWTSILVLPGITSVINQDEEGNLYFVCNNGDPYYKSSDNGLSWEVADIDHVARGWTVINGIHYTIDNRRLFRSEDEGATWTNVLSFVFGISSPQLGPDQALFATSGGNNTTFLHRSEDNGLTWERVWSFCAEPHQFVTNTNDQLVIGHHDGHINIYPRPIVNNLDSQIKESKFPLVYPNPLSIGDVLFFNKMIENYSLIDMKGRILKSGKGGINQFELPSNITSGVYIIRLVIDERLFHQLIVIE